MKFLCLFLMLFSCFTVKASKINSIITLDKNIPKECGLNVSVKKNMFIRTSFYGNSIFKIKNSNILSNSTSIVELIGKKEFKKKRVFF